MQYVPKKSRTTTRATVIAANSGASPIIVPDRTAGIRLSIRIQNTGSQNIEISTGDTCAAGSGIIVVPNGSYGESDLIDNGSYSARSTDNSAGQVAIIEKWRG